MSKPKAKKVASASTEGKQRPGLANLIPFQPGQSGNPKGRAKGSRNRLSEAFIAALDADFAEHGEKVIATVRAEKPAEYLKVIAGVLPKELNVTTTSIEELSDDDLAAGIAALQSILASQDVREGSDSETKH